MIAFDFIDNLARSSSESEAGGILLDAVRPAGFVCMAMAELPETGGTRPLASLGWPSGWLERFLSAGFGHTNPVIRSARSTTEVFAWSKARSDAILEGTYADKMSGELRAAGITDGLAVPVLGLNGSQWVILLGGRPAVLNFDLQQLLRLASIYALNRARNIAARNQARVLETPLDTGVAIHVVGIENRSIYEREIAGARGLSNFAARCCGPLAGGVPNWHDDDIHLLAIERQSGRVVGWVQLEETTSGISGVAPNRSLEPRSPAILRLAGLNVQRGSEQRRIGRAAATMLAGIQEFGLKCNVEQVTIQANMLDVPALLELGWNPDPIAVPTQLSGIATLPLTIDITETALRRTRLLLDIRGPVLVRRKLRRSLTTGAPMPSRLYH